MRSWSLQEIDGQLESERKYVERLAVEDFGSTHVGKVVDDHDGHDGNDDNVSKVIDDDYDYYEYDKNFCIIWQIYGILKQ